MKKILCLILVLLMLLPSIVTLAEEAAVPTSGECPSYNREVIQIPDESDAPVYMIDGYFYIGDDTIMRKDGTIITKGKYKFDFITYRAECFENGYIPVEDKATGMMGLMNEEGEIVAEVKYSNIEIFDEKGMAIAAVQLEGNKYGMIDKEGNVVIPFEFDYMRRCNHDELFVAGLNKYSTDPDADKVVDRTYYGLIDRRGNIVLPMEYRYIESFDKYGFIETEGFDWEQGLVNSKGEVILEAKYRDIYIYNDGEYIRAVDHDLKGYWFDRDGNNIFPEYECVRTPWQEGWGFLMPVKDGKEGLAKYDGTIILESVYDNVEPTVKDGLVMLEKDGKKEWAKSNGEIIEGARYEDWDIIYSDNDSMYALKQDGLWAVAIGEDVVGEFKYTDFDDLATSVDDVMFGTKADGTIDGIDELTGEIIYENVISSSFNYRTNYYCTKDNQAYRITYDRGLKPAWPDKYIYVGEFIDNVAVARNKENLWGLINEKGEPITEFKYESFNVCVGVNHGDAVYNQYIYYIDDGLVMVMLDGKIGYINLKGEMVIEPKFGYDGMLYGLGEFNQGYAQHYLEGKNCHIDRDGNIYEQDRIAYDYYPAARSYTDHHYYTVLHKDGDVEIWDENTKERIMFSVGNTIYWQDGSFVVDTILRNENGSLKVRYEYDEGISVWTEFGRFIIDIE